MIAKEKATEVVKNLLSWLEQNAKKCVLVKADSSVIAETENLTFEKEGDDYVVRYANGYAVGRIFANFNLQSAYGNDIVLDIAYLQDENGNNLTKSLYVGTLPAGTKDFSVVVEVAISYILD